jgi:hypothetical protein
VDLAHSEGIAGSKAADANTYVHLTSSALLRTAADAPSAPIALSEANARLTEWNAQRDQVQFRLEGHAPLDFSLVLPRTCQVRINDRVATPSSVTPMAGTSVQRFRLSHAAALIQAQCARR